MLQTEPGRSRLYLRAIYAHPIKIQLSLFVEQLKKCLVFMSGFYLNKSVNPVRDTFGKCLKPDHIHGLTKPCEGIGTRITGSGHLRMSFSDE